MLLAIGGIIAALTISIKIDSLQKLSWAAKFLKSFLQDLLVTPLLILLLNYLLITCGRKIAEKRALMRTIILRCCDPVMIKMLAVNSSKSSKARPVHVAVINLFIPP